MNAALAELKSANAAARSIRVLAVNMLYAQGFTLTTEDRAVLTRQANALRAVLDTKEAQTLRVNVYDAYAPGVKIGELQYML